MTNALLPDITILTDTAPRAEIEEALALCVKDAKRTLSRDGLGRVNAEWEVRHRFLDHLLGMWERAS